jgi:hypothetical protein
MVPGGFQGRVSGRVWNLRSCPQAGTAFLSQFPYGHRKVGDPLPPFVCVVVFNDGGVEYLRVSVRQKGQK